jgi:hypothetical protein
MRIVPLSVQNPGTITLLIFSSPACPDVLYRGFAPTVFIGTHFAGSAGVMYSLLSNPSTTT